MRGFLLLLVVFSGMVAIGCSSAVTPVRLPASFDGAEAVVPPTIDDIQDLGALPLVGSGPIDPALSDGRFTAGEWVAVTGEGLAARGAQVFIDDVETELEGFLQGGGLLTRIPPGLCHLDEHVLRVQTAAGTAEESLTTHSHLVVSDMRAGLLRIYPSSEDADLVFSKDPVEIDHRRAHRHVPSAKGGVLYSIGRTDEAPDGGVLEASLLAVHMGAAGAPEKVGETKVRVPGVVNEMAMSRDGEELALCTDRGVVLLDLGDPANPEEAKTLHLPNPVAEQRPYYVSCAYVGDAAIALLERSTGAVVLVDTNGEAEAKVLTALEDTPEGSAGLALVADTRAADALFVLRGADLSHFGEQVSKGLGNLVRLRLPEPTAGGDPTIAGSIERVETNRSGLEAETRHLTPLAPRFAPLFMRAAANGDLILSGVGMEAVSKFTKLELGPKGLVQAVEAIKDMVSMGEILRFPVNERTSEIAKPRTLVRGLALLLSFHELPGRDQVVYTSLNLAPRLLPPGLRARLSVDIRDTLSLPLRDLKWTAVIPPYGAPQITVH